MSIFRAKIDVERAVVVFSESMCTGYHFLYYYIFFLYSNRRWKIFFFLKNNDQLKRPESLHSNRCRIIFLRIKKMIITVLRPSVWTYAPLCVDGKPTQSGAQALTLVRRKTVVTRRYRKKDNFLWCLWILASYEYSSREIIKFYSSLNTMFLKYGSPIYLPKNNTYFYQEVVYYYSWR